MVFVRATVALATFAGTFTTPILLLALRSAADVAVFSPVSRFFALVWGLLLFLRNFRFCSLATLMVYPSSGPAACAAFPAAGYLGGFQVTGCLSFCFPGDVGWASALPFFFCASPAPLACRGWLGYAPCVRVLQLRWCLLGLKVRSPCCPSLTLGWLCFWPPVSQAFVGCEGGLGCPSWFVLLFMCLFVLYLFWGWGGLVTGLWPLLRLRGFGLF